MYKYSVLLTLVSLASSSAKKLDYETGSMTYKIMPEATKNAVADFYSHIEETVMRNAKTDLSRMENKNLRSEAIPNVPLSTPTGYADPIPKVPVATEFLQKEVYVLNKDCQIKYNKNSNPTVYLSHLMGVDTCYLSTFTSDIDDKSTYLYAKATYKNVEDATAGDAFDLIVNLYKDSDCLIHVRRFNIIYLYEISYSFLQMNDIFRLPS